MTLLKDTLVTADGGLHQLVPDYVNWKVGSSTITLDGDFTVAELRWLADYMSSKQSDGVADKV